jgi:hypothetical protein
MNIVTYITRSLVLNQILSMYKVCLYIEDYYISRIFAVEVLKKNFFHERT